MTDQTPDKKVNILLELRPALEGFAGIPQETRLLFRGLRMLKEYEVEGMLQTSHRVLAKGTRNTRYWRKATDAKKINRYSRIVISMAEKPYRNAAEAVLAYMEKKLNAFVLGVLTSIGLGRVKLTSFDSTEFKDFVWRTLFSKTLPAHDYELVSSAKMRICSTPWHTMHMAGLKTLNTNTVATYPTIDAEDIDIFIGQTPFPGKLTKGTRFVVRYHDALPVFMPHTIPDKSIHQATHFHALASNVAQGATFACVSEATRQDLLKLFPAAKTVTIHNMVSHHYFNEDSPFDRVRGIIRTRLHEGDAAKGINLLPKFLSLREKESFYRKHLHGDQFKYLLVVSTIEPRKNHSRLLAAWEVIKADLDPNLKLVVVGGLGWDYGPTVRAFSSWIDRGELFVLSSVPSPDLRVLYHHAAATVCPSLGEGFDFSGAESMASGGVTIASDIPVHREVYEDAAEYFNPYATGSLVTALKKVIYSEESDSVRQDMLTKGQQIASRYQPEKILPQWKNFLDRISAE